MNKFIKLFFKYSILFSYGGMIYMCLELLFRHKTHYTMAFCGGFAFVIIGCINNVISWDISLVKQCLIGGICVITPLEYLFGILFNQDYSIWCYKDIILNYQGQICIPFTILWCFVSIIAIFLDDYLRYYIFNEEKPYYKIW